MPRYSASARQRGSAHALTDASVAGVSAAALPAPSPSNLLTTKGALTLGHETNLACAPLWDVRARPIQLELMAPSVLYGRQC